MIDQVNINTFNSLIRRRKLAINSLRLTVQQKLRSLNIRSQKNKRQKALVKVETTERLTECSNGGNPEDDAYIWSNQDADNLDSDLDLLAPEPRSNSSRRRNKTNKGKNKKKNVELENIPAFIECCQDDDLKSFISVVTDYTGYDPNECAFIECNQRDDGDGSSAISDITEDDIEWERDWVVGDCEEHESHNIQTTSTMSSTQKNELSDDDDDATAAEEGSDEADETETYAYEDEEEYTMYTYQDDEVLSSSSYSIIWVEYYSDDEEGEKSTNS